MGSGYRRMGSPQAWERVPPTASYVDPFGFNGMNLYQNQLALQQSLMDQMNAVTGFGFNPMASQEPSCPQPPVDRRVSRRPANLSEYKALERQRTFAAQQLAQPRPVKPVFMRQCILSPSVSRYHTLDRRMSETPPPYLPVEPEKPGLGRTISYSLRNSPAPAEPSHLLSRQASFAFGRKDSVAVPVTEPDDEPSEAATFDGFTVGDKVIRKG